MSFCDFLSGMGTIIVIVACVYLLSNPLPLEDAPNTQVAPQQSLPEPQAAQLVASSPTMKRSRVEELVGSSEVASASFGKRTKLSTRLASRFSSSERRLMSKRSFSQSSKTVVRSSSVVAGAQQQINTKPSLVTPPISCETSEVASVYAEISEVVELEVATTDVPVSLITTTTTLEIAYVASVYAEISEAISVEVEMTDAPAFTFPPLKSCLKTSTSRKATKSVSFTGRSGHTSGTIITYDDFTLGGRYTPDWYLAERPCPHVRFPLIQEVDEEGNPTGYFRKRDGFSYPVKSRHIL